MNSCRIIQSGFADAATNMATDEALFISYKEGISRPTLRLYGWRPASLSIGCFQNPREVLDLENGATCGISFVRRPTGGGIIFHHHELTYSLVLAQTDIGLSKHVKESFEKITSFLITAYQTLGVQASFAKEFNEKSIPNEKRADFCFSRNEDYDILIQGKKIGGNAQKRRKNIILQHGSIPFSFDKNTVVRLIKNPKLIESLNILCLKEITQLPMDPLAFSDALIHAFGCHFNVKPEKSDLTKKEKVLRDELIVNKYANPEWNMDRKLSRVVLTPC